jgi:glycosyltransferase involved in cell wall biosynthesis
MNKLSVVIITFNEEKNIKRCLDSVIDIADEIIVIDSHSTDKTEEICKQFNVRFYPIQWLGYSETKNYGNNLAVNDYVFSIDADEVVSEKLKKSIIEFKNAENPKDCYTLTRLTNYCGKWIYHCGWYPDAKMRIWNKNLGKWEGELHEEVKMKEESSKGYFDGDLHHFSYHSIQEHVNQYNKFTEIGAMEAFKKGKKANLFIAFYKSIWKFKRDYIFKFGFLDGYYGFIICRLSANATFLKYIKLRELIKNSKPNAHS